MYIHNIAIPTDVERARRVISRSNCRPTGKYPGLKSRRMHYWESLIERDGFHLLDMDRSVVEFHEQPALIHYELNGESLRHYPDILVNYAGWSEFVEVKSDDDADSEEVQQRTEAIRPQLQQRGYGYRVWRASEIRSGYRLRNAIYLLRYGRAPIPLVRREAIRQRLIEEGQMTWGHLTGPAFGTNALQDACALVLEGWLRLDQDSELTHETLVSQGEAI